MLDDHKLPNPAPKPKKTKKRKAVDTIDDPAVKDLREKAKFYCKNVTEWRIVAKYNKTRLEEYLVDQDFLAGAQLSDQFSDVTTNVIAYLVDKISKGDGYVEQELKCDISLRNCIQKELVDVLKIMTNRMQIAIFSVVDIVSGKKKQQQHPEEKKDQYAASVQCYDNGQYSQRHPSSADNTQSVEHGGEDRFTTTPAHSDSALGSENNSVQTEDLPRPS